MITSLKVKNANGTGGYPEWHNFHDSILQQNFYTTSSATGIIDLEWSDHSSLQAQKYRVLTINNIINRRLIAIVRINEYVLIEYWSFSGAGEPENYTFGSGYSTTQSIGVQDSRGYPLYQKFIMLVYTDQ